MREATVTLRTKGIDEETARSEMVSILIDLAREVARRSTMIDVIISKENGSMARMVILRGDKKT